MTSTDGPPIFVTGNGRSGTTLMRLMLSAHPRIYICHELEFYQWASICRGDLDGMTFLSHYFRSSRFQLLRLDPEAVRANLPARLDRSDIGQALREIMRQKAASLGRARYGDKTPSNVRFLERIYADFPDAKVVVMFRDPRSNVPSLGHMPFGSRSDLANSLTYVMVRRTVWPFRDRALLVRLEDLQGDPRSVMRQVLDFVGEPWSENVLHHSTYRADRLDMQATPWFRRAAEPLERDGAPTSALSPERIRLIEVMTRQSMAELGYQRLKLDGAPSRLRTSMMILSQVPETLKFWWTVIRIVRRLRDPGRWELDDETLHALFRRLNPGALRSPTSGLAEARARD